MMDMSSGQESSQSDEDDGETTDEQSTTITSKGTTAPCRRSRRKTNTARFKKGDRVAVYYNEESEIVMFGTIVSLADSFGCLWIIIDEKYREDERDDGYRSYTTKQFIENFCVMCECIDKKEHLLACNKCNIGMHKACVLSNRKQTEDEINYP